MSITTIVLIAVAVLVVWLIAEFNGLVRLRTRAREAASDIDVQLKRRHDLIPNLVETVRGYMKHEASVFENVTRARAEAMSATGMNEKAKAEDNLSHALKSLFAVAENYPQLKANENFAKLQDELTDTEDKIQAARRFYNTNVRDLNIRIATFPSNLIAGPFRFTPMEFIGVDEAGDRAPVAVKF